MKKDELEKRISELRADRERLVGELDKARAEERDALIEGKKPDNVAAAIATRIAVIDDALGELNDRQAGMQGKAQRNDRRKRAEAALEKTRERAKLAKAVDDALTALASAWPSYQEALRKELGTVSAANGDVGPIERGLVANRQNEILVRALVRAGGMGLARALGVETAIRERHAISLAEAEQRVAESLHTELLRIRAESPQTHLAREAKQELEQLRGTGSAEVAPAASEMEKAR